MLPSEASKRQMAVTSAININFKIVRMLVMMILFGSNIAIMLRGGSLWLAARVMIVVLQTVLYRQLSELSTYPTQFELSLLRRQPDADRPEHHPATRRQRQFCVGP